VVQRPAELSAFEFAVLAGLRAGQLARGCTPRVKSSDKIAVTAQMEVAERHVARDPTVGVGGGAVLGVVAGGAMRLR
jgi:DNA-directed RNA polymerase subunit K/omega